MMDSEFNKYLFANSRQNVENKKKTGNVEDKIFELERKIAKCTAEIDCGNIRSSLLSSQHKKIEQLITQVEEVRKRIHQKYEKHKDLLLNATANPTFYARKLPTDRSATQLESPCMKCVRETCEAISSYYNNEYSKTADETSTERTTKDQLWSQVENISHTFHPDEVSKALLNNIEESTTNLNEIASNINLTKDAHTLKFKFETGKLKDISSKPVLLQTVHQLIEESQVAHFQQFLLFEEAKNHTWDLECKLNTINEEITTTLKHKYDADTAKNMRNLFSLQQEHGLMDSSLKFLRSEINKLQDERKEKEKAMKMLIQKYDRIQTFEKTVQAKQTTIQKLIKNNGLSKSRHQQQHQNIIVSAEEKLVKLQCDVHEASEDFKRLCREEAKKFMLVPVQNLKCVRSNSNDKKTLACELSINRLDPRFDQPGEKQLRTVLNIFDIPLYTPPECIIPSVANIKNKIHNTHRNKQSSSRDLESLNMTSTSVNAIQQQLTGVDDEETLSLLPSLKKSKAKSSHIMEECVMFKNAAQIWWDQPAQTAAPWILEDGYNLQQYLEQFTAHADVIRKMQLIATP